MAIGGEHFKTTFGNRREYQSENTERGELQDPFHRLRDDFGKVVHDIYRLFARHFFHGKTKNDSPEKDSDIVGIGGGQQWVRYHVGEKVGEHIA